MNLNNLLSPNPQAVVLPADVAAAFAAGAVFAVVFLGGLLLWSRWQLRKVRARLVESEIRSEW